VSAGTLTDMLRPESEYVANCAVEPATLLGLDLWFRVMRINSLTKGGADQYTSANHFDHDSSRRKLSTIVSDG
jgi:hypothetical protein